MSPAPGLSSRAADAEGGGVPRPPLPGGAGRGSISYVIPGLRSLTGGFRTPWIDLRWDQPSLRQPNTVP